MMPNFETIKISTINDILPSTKDCIRRKAITGIELNFRSLNILSELNLITSLFRKYTHFVALSEKGTWNENLNFV